MGGGKRGRGRWAEQRGSFFRSFSLSIFFRSCPSHMHNKYSPIFCQLSFHFSSNTALFHTLVYIYLSIYLFLGRRMGRRRRRRNSALIVRNQDISFNADCFFVRRSKDREKKFIFLCWCVGIESSWIETAASIKGQTRHHCSVFFQVLDTIRHCSCHS